MRDIRNRWNLHSGSRQALPHPGLVTLGRFVTLQVGDRGGQSKPSEIRRGFPEVLPYGDELFAVLVHQLENYYLRDYYSEFGASSKI
jgi:hypothetical protein